MYVAVADMDAVNDAYTERTLLMTLIIGILMRILKVQRVALVNTNLCQAPMSILADIQGL